MKNILIVISIFICGETLAQQKRLYIANDDHTDYMWTANESKYDTAFLRMLDFYLHQIDSTKNNEPDYQARFNTDGSIWLQVYEKYRTPAQFKKLIAAIKSGHISSPLNMLVSCYGAQPTEAVIRGMYYAGQLERKHNLRFTLAGSMENNTLPLGLASLWAGAGAKYSWKGIGGYGSQMSYEMRKTRRHQMYRYNGLDSSGVLMKWYAYNEQKTAPLGGYAECRLIIKYKDVEKDLGNVVNVLDKFCDTITPGSTYPYNVGGAFGFGHDDLETLISNPFINAAKNNTNEARRVRVSNSEDFFIDFDRSYPRVPAQSVTYGNEWDLLSASMNEISAKMRRSTEKLRAAEALATIVSLKDRKFMDQYATAKNLAWNTFGVYWEHNWTADGPVSRNSRADWQTRMQQNLSNYVDTLYNQSIIMLGSQLKSSENKSFFVFNPLSWVRNDYADIEYVDDEQLRVVERSTGSAVNSQVIFKNGKKYLRVQANEIPSVGYRVFEMETGKDEIIPDAATFKDGYFSNDFFKLKLTKSGVITALYDLKNGNRQLVKAHEGRYVNDLGSTDLNDGAELVVENAGPVSVTIKAVSKNPMLHTVRVTLFANSPRIDIEDSIQANFGGVQSWAFSFDFDNPTTRHEELGAVLTAKLETRNGHYAKDNARYDWQTFNHFANLSEANYGITLSNTDCSFFKLGNSSLDSLWENASQIYALAGGNIDKKVEDGGILGILNQHGNKDFLYNFSLNTHQGSFDPLEAMKFSLEHQNPFVAGIITGTSKGSSANNFSLLNVNNPNLVLWSIKPSEDGIQNGLITRFWNMEAKESTADITLSAAIKQAWKTSHIETNEEKLKARGRQLTTASRAHQISTYRFIVPVK
jgi:alpha-mannosidase